MSETDGYRDAELASLDLEAMLRDGVADGDGRVRPELQGHGAVAAAIQLENHLVDAGDVGRMVAALRGRREEGGLPRLDPPAPPALGRLVSLGWGPAETPGEREAFTRWLGNVATVMVVRSGPSAGARA